MNFYQELQLNQAGSKSYIASFKNPKDKCKHIAVYLFKIALVVAFCVSFVTLFSVLFGNEKQHCRCGCTALRVSSSIFRPWNPEFSGHTWNSFHLWYSCIWSEAV